MREKIEGPPHLNRTMVRVPPRRRWVARTTKGDIMKRKGQGLSMQTIIIAALCLIVLLVLFTIFRSGTKESTQGIANISDEAGKKAKQATEAFGDLFGDGDEEEEVGEAPDSGTTADKTK